MTAKIVAIAAASALLGGTVGYFVGRKHEALKAADYVNEQIGEMRAYYHQKRGQVEAEAQEAKDEADIQRRAYERIVTKSGYVIENNVENIQDTPEEEVEVMDTEVVDPNGYEPEPYDLRHRDKAYLVSEEEFFINEDNYDQITFTYFVNDDVLLDEKDNPVPNPEEVLGDGLSVFIPQAGPNVVYIFNEKLEIGFEVVKDEDSYEEKVYGYSEPKEARVKKFRGGD